MDANRRIIQNFPDCREICFVTTFLRHLFGSGLSGLGITEIMIATKIALPVLTALLLTGGAADARACDLHSGGYGYGMGQE